MPKYDAKSMKAEEFINHEEILDTLAYAKANAQNAELIDSILEKARLRKGLSHREASVLLACESLRTATRRSVCDLRNRSKRTFTATES